MRLHSIGKGTATVQHMRVAEGVGKQTLEALNVRKLLSTGGIRRVCTDHQHVVITEAGSNVVLRFLHGPCPSSYEGEDCLLHAGHNSPKPPIHEGTRSFWW